MPEITEDELETTTPASPEASDSEQDDTPEPSADDAGGSDYDPLTHGLEDEDAADDGAFSADRPRGPDGKFIEKDKAAPPTEETPPTSGLSGVAAASEAAGAPPSEPIAPWVANLYGEEAAPIPGALYKPGHGVFVPEAELGTLTALVARGRRYDEFKRERQDAAKYVESAVAPVQAEAKVMGSVLAATVLNPDWITQAALDPQGAIREIALSLREQHLELREQFRTPQPPTPQTTGEASEVDPYDAHATIRAEVTDLLRLPDYHGVFAPQDVQAMERRLSTLHPFVQDESGRWFLDRQVVRELLDTAAESRRLLARDRQTTQAQQAAQVAAKRNQQVTATTTPTPKPGAKAKTAARPKTAAFEGDPWDNPALSFEERKAAWEKAHFG